MDFSFSICMLQVIGHQCPLLSLFFELIGLSLTIHLSWNPVFSP